LVDITQQSDADGLRDNAEPENVPDFAAAAEEGIPLITPLRPRMRSPRIEAA